MTANVLHARAIYRRKTRNKNEMKKKKELRREYRRTDAMRLMSCVRVQYSFYTKKKTRREYRRTDALVPCVCVQKKKVKINRTKTKKQKTRMHVSKYEDDDAFVLPNRGLIEPS